MCLSPIQIVILKRSRIEASVDITVKCKNGLLGFAVRKALRKGLKALIVQIGQVFGKLHQRTQVTAGERFRPFQQQLCLT